MTAAAAERAGGVEVAGVVVAEAVPAAVPRMGMVVVAEMVMPDIVETLEERAGESQEGWASDD